jgi:hypothetical protein
VGKIVRIFFVKFKFFKILKFKKNCFKNWSATDETSTEGRKAGQANVIPLVHGQHGGWGAAGVPAMVMVRRRHGGQVGLLRHDIQGRHGGGGRGEARLLLV